MSYYYTYYLGYKTKENKIYPLGPYDCDGELHSALCKSRSFASDLHEMFYHVSDEQVTDELRKRFEYTNFNGEKVVDLKYLPLSKLPSGDGIRSGYFLISDIDAYEKDESIYDGGLFYDYLTPTEYNIKMSNELIFGPKEQKKDVEGNEIEEYNCSDYGYYSFLDFYSAEYESEILRHFAESYEFANAVYTRGSSSNEIVILLSEG